MRHHRVTCRTTTPPSQPTIGPLTRATRQDCQRRLREYREIGELIHRRFPPPMIDPARKAMLIARLREDTAHRRRRAWFWRPVLAGAVTVLVLFQLATALPSISEMDSLLGDFIRFGEIQVKERFEDPKPLAVPTIGSGSLPSVPDLAFSTVLPVVLPLGFEVVAREAPTPHLLTLYLQNEAGSSMMLNQEPAATGQVTIDAKNSTDIVTLRDTSVLLLGDPHPGIVSALFWERNGVGFGLMVVDEPSGGLLRQDALAIVEAIMVAQDGGELEARR